MVFLGEQWRNASMDIHLASAKGELHQRWALPKGQTWTGSEWHEVSLSLDPVAFASEDGPSNVTVEASEMPEGARRPVSYEAALGWHRVNLDGIEPIVPPGDGDRRNDAIERVKLKLANSTDREQVARLMFEKTARGIRQHIGAPITGISAILRDAQGNPTGIPVQLSKDWHSKSEGGVYAEQWFHGISQVRLPAGATVELELTLFYGQWGGVAAASHAQLCLIGWGSNQLWEQSALGAWGESICYEPDQVQRGNTITDVRPVMVNSKGKGEPWGWTNNVGGGDFLALFDPDRRHIHHSAMRTTYRRQGPCLTEVTHAGRIGNGITHSETVSLTRTDDLVRGIYQLRFDVTKPTGLSRFVIFQVGADNCNFSDDRKLAVGNDTGLVKEWAANWGGNTYRTPPMECTGRIPWISGTLALLVVSIFQNHASTCCASLDRPAGLWRKLQPGAALSTAMRSLFLTAALSLIYTFSQGAGRPNILFIASDDMRPQLGCYGDPTVKSPNLDRLAARGMVFERSFVQQALCSPSRISMLSGRYPATTQIFEIGRPLRATMPDITTLPQHFKNNGYHTRSLGKIYHVGIDDDASWTIPAWHSKAPRNGPTGVAAMAARRKEYAEKTVKAPVKGKGAINYAVPAFDAVDCGDEDLMDGDCATNAIAQLRDHAKNPDRSFFLAVGFANPHVPWVSPKKYWDLYDRSKIPLATNEFLPRYAPKFAATSGMDFHWYANVPEGDLPEPFKRECLHGYLAAISYVDAQVGRLLAALDETGLARNTIVVFWSDHGYYMGEHTWWGAKHNNYEGATRNCFIVATPDMKTAGQKTQSLVQAVDIAPTLTELCGLPANSGFQGRSLKPVLDDAKAVVDDAAFSWYPKEGWLGVAMRTDKWRYVEWTKPGEQTERELYNMVHDPQNDLNVVDKPEHEKIVQVLSQRLRERFPVQVFKNPGDALPKKNKRDDL